MEQKTRITAPEGKQEVFISRDFDLPLDLLFTAYTEAEFVSQWMNTKVVSLESKRHGSYHFETTDPMGNVHRFHGAIHELVQDTKIIRTFEIENGGLGIQLEILEFSALNEDRSRLIMHVLYESVEKRDNVIRKGFTHGISMAHNRIEELFTKNKEK